MGNRAIRVCKGRYGCNDVVIFSFEETNSDVAHIAEEYALAYIPVLDEWRGDAIAYGHWIDIDQEEITKLRRKYYLNELVPPKRNNAHGFTQS